MKRNIIIYSLAAILAGGTFTACNLDEELDDSVSRPTAQLDPGDLDPETALQPVYNSMSLALQTQESVYALAMHSSDELIPPVRGTDWYDFGVWTTLHTHQWNSTHPQILRAWNDLNQGITRANQAIASTSGERNAQARFLRAYLVWQVADLFGQVPFRDENDVDFLTPPEVLTRADAIDFVITELEAAAPNMPTMGYGDPTLGAAHAMLARAYLNKFVYEGSESPSDADMQKVVENAMAVENLGYSLIDGDSYFSGNFGVNNESSPEAIFVLINQSGDNRGGALGSRYHQTLHYNQNPSGWNGFTTLAEFYNKFDANDKRFKGEPTENMAANSGLGFGFLDGQQFGQDGTPLTTRSGAPLVFTPEVPLTGATEDQGIRIVKYEPDYSNTANPANDFFIIRYADVLLMKAEAYWRLGNDAEALAAINELRENRGVTALTSLSADAILDERGFELYWEAIRRTDLIRFRRFGEEWEEKPASDETRQLFAIPQSAVDSNPNLEQNPGY